MIRFHGYFRSAAAYRSRIAFNPKGPSYGFVPVHLRRGGGEQEQAAYRSLNPQALVPVLAVDGLVPTQSPAIVEWLDGTHPEPPLPPTPTLRSNPTARAEPAAGRVPRMRLQLDQDSIASATERAGNV